MTNHEINAIFIAFISGLIVSAMACKMGNNPPTLVSFLAGASVVLALVTIAILVRNAL